jgi:hypothetical protein
MTDDWDDPENEIPCPSLPIPADSAPPSPLACSLFAALSSMTKVVVAVRRLARKVKPRAPIADANPAIDQLEALGLVVRWQVARKAPAAFGEWGPCVSLSPYAAAVMGVRLNSRGSSWQPIKGWRDRSARIVVRTMGRREDGSEVTVITESAMALDPPGRLTDVPDYRENAQPHASILAEERRDGLVRPNYLHGMGIAWDTLIQDPGPWAPKIDRPARDEWWTCPGCGRGWKRWIAVDGDGRIEMELDSSGTETGNPLVIVTEPDAMVDDVDGLIREDCLLCGRYCRDGRLAVARRVMRGIEQDERERMSNRSLSEASR